MKRRPVALFEPFAGGGIVGLTVAFEHLAGHVVMVELDDEIAAVWKTILSDDAEWLARKIQTFGLTAGNIQALLTQSPHSLHDKAFLTLLRNRTNHGGILAPGAGMIKHGENGKGIHSRWYPETLAKRIMDIAAIRERITFIEGDGLDVVRQSACRPDVVFFIDPPYTAGGKRAGRRLYRHCEVDHDELFSIVEKVAGDFLMTYDDAPELRWLAEKHGFDTEVVPMQNTHLAKMTELLIGRCLDYVRTYRMGLVR